jgi:hypothetical protein
MTHSSKQVFSVTNWQPDSLLSPEYADTAKPTIPAIRSGSYVQIVVELADESLTETLSGDPDSMMSTFWLRKCLILNSPNQGFRPARYRHTGSRLLATFAAKVAAGFNGFLKFEGSRCT